MIKDRVFIAVCVLLCAVCIAAGIWLVSGIFSEKDPVTETDGLPVVATVPETTERPAETTTEPAGLVFKESLIESAVRSYLGKDGAIFSSDLDGITMLDILATDVAVNEKRGSARISYYYGEMKLEFGGAVYTQPGGIASLDDLQYFKNLTYLRIWFNSVTDLSPLASLDSLTFLSLDGNQVSDLAPLANLKHLNYLDLWKNKVKDISVLANLTEMQTLYLFGNQIEDISALSGLKKLKNVDLDKNKIQDWSPVSHVVNVTGRP